LTDFGDQGRLAAGVFETTDAPCDRDEPFVLRSSN
jgi:hypothetical protein